MHYFGRDMGVGVCPELHRICGGKDAWPGVFSADVTHDSDAKKLKERCKEDGVFSKLKQQFWLPKW